MGLRRFLKNRRATEEKRRGGPVEQRWTEGKSQIRVGRFTYGAEALTIHQWDEGADLSIGQFCSLAPKIDIFLGGNHRSDWITTFPFGHVFEADLGATRFPGHPATRGDISIGNDVWIGRGAVLMSGVTIGDGAVIAAHSVIARDVPPYMVAGGNPGRVLKPRFPAEIIRLLLELRWWDLPAEAIRDIAPVLSEAPSEAVLRELLARYCGRAGH